jgi:hypothetical protein
MDCAKNSKAKKLKIHYLFSSSLLWKTKDENEY